ncbi:MAG: ABC transporter ATP-binding protein [Bauldia sp.]|nr:ABC transporter ATP-binding protein [Bauldia sp.]
MTETPLLSVRDLVVEFPRRGETFRAVDGISFDIAPGEILGVVGESGAGKSMTGAAIIGLIEPPGRITRGEIHLAGSRIDNLPEAKRERLRGKRIGMVFQDPLTSLNPLFTIGRQLTETIRRHLPLTPAEARQRAVDLLTEAGIPRAGERLDSYPHQFSGGMRQRVVIALAIAGEPELVIADEPTSALDVSVQAQIIAVLKRLCTSHGAAVLLISHDMGVIAETAARVVVMHHGRIVETGSVGDIIKRPREPYTVRLIEAIPSIRRLHGAPATAPAGVPDAAPLVEVRGLSRDFVLTRRGPLQRLLGRKEEVLHAVKDVSFTVARGTTFGLVGESGSGKSTCAWTMVGLLRPTAGTVLLSGHDIWDGREGERYRRRRVQMIFQDPYASLNPRWRVGDIIAEPMRALKLAEGRSETEDRVAELLRRVRLDPAALRRFPHEFSGGQRQRIAIARALSSRPEFIVCDEPTSALDVSVQAQVLDLMQELQREFGLTYLLISHNLAVVRQMADHVGVMHRGALVEERPVDALFDDPKHEYTQMLLAAVPDISRVA